MRVLICGGRYFGEYRTGTPREAYREESDRVAKERFLFNTTLDALLVDHGRFEIIHGGARGADALAAYWAKRTMCPVEEFKADWKALKKAAGPIRNQRMIDEGHPDLVVAFPGGSGTADCIRRAKAAGIPVQEVE